MFVKGRELYGLFEARAALRQRGYVLGRRGLHGRRRAGPARAFRNAVATLGTACTAEHVQKLFRFTDSVVFSFDGDAAGRRAAAPRARSRPAPCDRHAHDPLPVPAARTRSRTPSCASSAPAAFEQRVERGRAAVAPACSSWPAKAATSTPPKGRARMLANAKPLWIALPDGRAQAAAARRARRSWRSSSAEELTALWEGRAGGAIDRRPPRRAHRRDAGASSARRGEPARPRRLAAAATQRAVDASTANRTTCSPRRPRRTTSSSAASSAACSSTARWRQCAARRAAQPGPGADGGRPCCAIAAFHDPAPNRHRAELATWIDCACRRSRKTELLFESAAHAEPEPRRSLRARRKLTICSAGSQP